MIIQAKICIFMWMMDYVIAEIIGRRACVFKSWPANVNLKFKIMMARNIGIQMKRKALSNIFMMTSN